MSEREAALELVLDRDRTRRLGFDEAIYCAGKSSEQLATIVATLLDTAGRGLLTRLGRDQLDDLPPRLRRVVDYEARSRTGVIGALATPGGPARTAVVSAGSSDVPVAREAVRTLAYYGEPAREIYDIGVAGLWRLLDRVDELSACAVVIACAGMDAALPSVLGGLVPGAVIAVPTSAGYGVSADGETPLRAALASCAPGVVVVNIDNGYGAACAALRVLGAARRGQGPPGARPDMP